MKITIYGAGYVGLVTGACLSEVGHNVLCMDTNKERIASLRRGESPIYEPGLSNLLAKNIHNKRLSFTDNVGTAVDFSNVQMIAVGTPQDKDGSANLTYIETVAKSIGKHLSKDTIIINKSTVPVGTGDKVKQIIQAELNQKSALYQIEIVSNPEFLREGCAIEDFQKPDRIIIGTNNADAKKIMDELYAPFSRNHYKTIFMDIRSAELTKYAANAMLATKISFINEMALIADQVGADIENVRIGIGSDPRIGYSFIYPGCGYGGSCFPKDVKALINLSEKSDPLVLKAVDQRNAVQQQLIAQKVLNHFKGDLTNKKIAIWGLAFKPKTDDIREATSLKTIDVLLQNNATIHAYDPVACEQTKRVYQEKIHYYNENPYDVLEQADALIIHTEWKDFVVPDLPLMAQKMKQKVIFDGRNLYEPKEMKKDGWTYTTIGRNNIT
jgi:UDPglucose 6-dehydrogenase